MTKIKILVSFRLPDTYIKKIENVSANVEVLQSRDKRELINLIADADVLFTGIFSRELFLAGKKLRWIQSFFAGVDQFLFPEVVKSQIILTNAGGVNSTSVSEHAIGLMLALNRKFHWFIRNQAETTWKTSDAELLSQLDELSGKTVGILGLGKIGGEIAKKTKCLGMRVTAARRNPSTPMPEYIDELVHPQDLRKLLAESDFVILALPLTNESAGIIGETQLRSMKRTAYLINVSRGKIVQEKQLIRALQEGWIAGAGLDAFEIEPLPQDSPLWKMKNVIITPHVAGVNPYYLERLTDIFCENLKHFQKGENLVNVVDKAAGY